METKKIIESIVAKNFKDLTEEETYIYDKAIWKQELNLLGNVHHNLVLVANWKMGIGSAAKSKIIEKNIWWKL